MTGGRVERALISVYDKSGLELFVPLLQKCDVEVISSGGTAKKLRELGLNPIDASNYTGFPESPGGLVKTLHPKIHGGLLLNPRDSAHAEYMHAQKINSIDILILNLYPFEKVVKADPENFANAIENIDIGGPAMLRAGAKGALLHGSPAVVVDPKQYAAVVGELEKTGGYFFSDTIHALAITAFSLVADYDVAIKDYLKSRTNARGGSLV